MPECVDCGAPMKSEVVHSSSIDTKAVGAAH